ncbi:MAG: DUF2807 domain-containing protein [Armatimonadetes bacterium]|nr:DUF2807 domain-containing protein [Armatimonadota bacterium]MDE2205850.1 DUF2807 domain-containing protein [Armatimonadota bacterium]
MKVRNMLAAASLLLLLPGCAIHDLIRTFAGPSVKGSGKLATQSRSVSAFHAVNIAGVGRLILTQAHRNSVSITADGNLQPYLSAQVRGGVLYLASKPRTRFITKHAILYEVSATKLDGLTATGAVEVIGSNVVGKTLQVQMDGACKMWLQGSVPVTDVNLAGACKYDGSRLGSDTATVSVSGAGDATVDASKTLNASVAGVGKIRYIGNPTVHSSITGIGEVKHL